MTSMINTTSTTNMTNTINTKNMTNMTNMKSSINTKRDKSKEKSRDRGKRRRNTNIIIRISMMAIIIKEEVMIGKVDSVHMKNSIITNLLIIVGKTKTFIRKNNIQKIEDTKIDQNQGQGKRMSIK